MLTNIWRRRLAIAAHGGGRVAVAVLVLSAALNGLNLLRHLVSPEGPAVTARTVVNQSDLVKAFAVDCVTAWLTAATTQQPDLGRCFASSDKFSLPTTPALIVSAPQAQATAQGPSRKDIATYGVIVALTQQPYPSATPIRAYYQISVAVLGNDAPRALTTPARVDPPPPAADVELGYPQPVSVTSTLGRMLAGFVTCYLTGAPGLERYITTDSGLTPLHAYATAAATAIQAATEAPDTPPDDTEIRVLVTVLAHSVGSTPYDLSYPLTVRASAGSWSVAAIDSVPVLSDTTSQGTQEK